MRKFLIATALAGSTFLVPSAHALTIVRNCAASDISATPALTNVSCSGFYDGNLLKQGNSTDVSNLVGILNGLTSSTTYSAATFQFGSFKTISPLNGATTIDFTQSPFNTKLYGMTLIGVHYGAGQGSPGYGKGPMTPGRNPKPTNVDTSAFYYFDAGKTGLDKIGLNWSASSNLTLFSTGVAGGVPEPATWALMILGFGGIGTAMRRSKAKVRVSYAAA
ncbi:MAG: PEPxxWA-CTERM sorting domain-containing protein [Sphingobium sp.]|jgi:hypothetical protein|nr:PEPxxWA-CTERM sorting domain-containing protein [Sphingobium sp.]MCI1272592.1 PEPxxWA-CTERM sorting domain-containing protein [Sphingobium sp.]MCI1754694.1 PEPxxWA-CTERM sorting domain-containing protein [Sphingobium sp.]MCI2053633.1 PEPxxWA-CTERM sorting domain-containing protein [Sphingobium sp.]